MPSIKILFRLSVLFASVCIPTSGWAQGPTINIQQCFSDILVDKTYAISNVDVRYALQEAWSKDLYESAKAEGKLNIIVKGLPVGASYDQANDKVQKERYQRSEDLNYSSYRALSRASLDPAAREIIEHCLDKASISQFGYSYIPWVHAEDPTLITLQMFWTWPSATPIEITTLRIDGATVEDDGKSHPQRLFDYSLLHLWKVVSYDKVYPNQSRSVTLKRARPDDSITISLETNPNIKLPPVTIPGEEKPKACVPTTTTADEWGTAFEKKFSFDTSQFTTKNSAGQPIPLGNGARWDYSVNLKDQGIVDEDATITGVMCTKFGAPSDYMELWGANPPWSSSAPGSYQGLTATCSGWWQNAGRAVQMTVTYAKYGYKCPSRDWAYSDGKWK